MKTNKSFTKRLKVTGTGKLLARNPGFNHFNAKQKREKQLGSKTLQAITLKPKTRARVMPFS